MDTKDRKDFDEKDPGLQRKELKERQFRPFWQHQWVDVRDTDGTWLEAQVIEANDSTIRVHYKGFSSTYDEELSTELKHPDALRIAPLHTHTKCPEKATWIRKYFPEQNLDVKDSSDTWLPAKVVEVNPHRQQVKVHYYEYAPKYDEWINFDSYRLAPLNEYTRGHNIKPTPIPWIMKRKLDEVYQSLPRRTGLERKEGKEGKEITSSGHPDTSVSSQKGGYLTENKEVKFAEILKRELGLEIVPMAEDGNCLFRSFSHQVYGDAEYHGIVREKCLKYMKSQQSYFESFIAGDFDAYIAKLEKDGEWGDQPEIQAMSELYGRPVRIYAYSTTPMKTFGNASSAKPPIHLTYHFQSHYNSAMPIKGFEKTILKEKPGQVEEAHIKTFCRLGTVDKVKMMSDVEATEEEQLRAVVAASRKQFDQENSDLLERIRKAKIESLKLQQEVEAKQVERVVEDSLQECRPIYLARQAGFSMSDCHEAYTLFKAPGVSDEIIAQRMIAYLLEEKGLL